MCLLCIYFIAVLNTSRFGRGPRGPRPELAAAVEQPPPFSASLTRLLSLTTHSHMTHENKWGYTHNTWHTDQWKYSTTNTHAHSSGYRTHTHIDIKKNIRNVPSTSMHNVAVSRSAIIFVMWQDSAALLTAVVLLSSHNS